MGRWSVGSEVEYYRGKESVVCYGIQDTAKHMYNRSHHYTYCMYTASTKHQVTAQSLSPPHSHTHPSHPSMHRSPYPVIPHPLPLPQPSPIITIASTAIVRHAQWSPPLPPLPTRAISRTLRYAHAQRVKDTIVVRAPVNVSSPFSTPLPTYSPRIGSLVEKRRKKRALGNNG